jgi:glycine oxidase
VTITVVGAGIVGLCIAYELASRGASVRVLEARGAGLGATRASAGILAPYIEGHSEELRALGVAALDHYDQFLARVAADAGQTIEYRRSGTLQVARDEIEAQMLSGLGGRLTLAGVAHDLLDPASARELEPALGAVVSALLIPDHGYVAVRAFVVALLDALARREVNVEAGQVARVEDVEGDVVVIAAGSWSADMALGGARVPVRPIRGQLLQLRLARPAISRVVWGERCYVVPWLDGSLLVGATVEDVGFDERPTAAGVRVLLDAATELVPEVAAAAFEEVRVGLRPATSDELPVIGASSTMRRVFYATGHYRNGVLLAPLTALAIADLVLEGRERPEVAAARPDRFGL